MLEVARLLRDSLNTSPSLNREGQGRSLPIGIDFVCFDAEDWGFPMWETDREDPGDTWALGAQHFAANLPQGYEARYGILLDMVGGEGAQFFKEGMSMQYANAIVNKVWAAAKAAGYASYFPDREGGYVTDDHLPLNKTAGIPTIDIIPFYPDCTASSFGPTWHTINDDMQHIDKNTLKAVGQTIIQVLFSEE
jgi:Zn-dependent M28 family amino/carboxypeptidase